MAFEQGQSVVTFALTVSTKSISLSHAAASNRAT